MYSILFLNLPDPCERIKPLFSHVSHKTKLIRISPDIIIMYGMPIKNIKDKERTTVGVTLVNDILKTSCREFLMACVYSSLGAP